MKGACQDGVCFMLWKCQQCAFDTERSFKSGHGNHQSCCSRLEPMRGSLITCQLLSAKNTWRVFHIDRNVTGVGGKRFCLQPARSFLLPGFVNRMEQGRPNCALWVTASPSQLHKVTVSGQFKKSSIACKDIAWKNFCQEAGARR